MAIRQKKIIKCEHPGDVKKEYNIKIKVLYLSASMTEALFSLTDLGDKKCLEKQEESKSSQTKKK